MWNIRKSTSPRNNVVYAPLQQTFSDDDDFEDEILFDRDPKITATTRNSSSGSSSKRSSSDVIELQNLNGSPLQFHRRRSEVAVRSGWSITQKICIFLSVLGILGAGVGAAIYFPRFLLPPNFVITPEWNVDFSNYGSDSCVRLVDMDGDGRLDILLGLTPQPESFPVFSDQNSGNSEEPFKKFCKQKGVAYPCGGELVAVRGYDGKQLWRLSTKSSILYIHCDQLDVDQDGQFDCLVSGYHATLHAVDPRKGVLLWTAEAKYLFHHWNIYQALVVPDVDADNVDEVLVLHAGYPHYNYKQIQISGMENGRFLLFSGATGKSLGKSVNLTSTVNLTSAEKGSYMSPVIYKPSQNYSLNILLGSGQLATPGSLWLIPWEVLHAQLMDMEVKFPLKKSLPALHKKRNIQIYRSLYKGLIVPPVIVDVNNDKIMDILMSAFDGKVILYDGLTLQKKWAADFAKYESFSIPAPGYFDDDQHLDFMMHWYNGTWPHYEYSMVVILSGKDGKILWKTASSLSSLTSDLSLQTVDVHRDAFVFKILGRKGSVSEDKELLHTFNKQAESVDQKNENPRKRDHGISMANSELECNSSRISVLTEEIFLMDRSNMAKPILLAKQIAKKFFYAPLLSTSTSQSLDHKGKHPLCAILRPIGKGTGAIGDLDGDGQPDYVSLTNMAAVLHNQSVINTTLQKRNIVSAIDSNLSVPLRIVSQMPAHSPSSTAENGGPAKTLKSTHFAPQGQQVWTEYLGSQQNSVYRRHLSDGGNTVSRRSTVLYYLVVIFTLLVVLL